MQVRITPQPLSGSVRAVSSKSYAHRLLLAAALADRPTKLLLRGLSEDLIATARCIEALGGQARFQATAAGAGVIETQPIQQIGSETVLLDCGESGTTARLCLPFAASFGRAFRMIGSGRLPERPMADLCQALRTHGCAVSADQLPLSVQGQLQSGSYTLPGHISSQYISALLLALPRLSGDSSITLTTPAASAAYLAITLDALQSFGIQITQLEQGFLIPGNQRFCAPDQLEVEGDWSNAAFWLVADALQQQRGSSALQVRGLRADSCQGDAAVGPAITRILAPELETVLDIDATPDLLPILAVLAAGQQKQVRFVNAARLRAKESDRLQSTAALLSALGGQADYGADWLLVEGTGALAGGQADGAGDHRIVMAAAIAALLSPTPVFIQGAEAVAKSYPDFFSDYQALGGNVDVI